MDFLAEIKKLDYSERLKLLENEETLNKIFFVDKKHKNIDFAKILDLYHLEDILKYYDSNMMSKITNMYPNSDYYFIHDMLRKDRKVFEKEMVKRDELIHFILFRCKEIYFSLSFSYDTVMSIIEYIDKNNIDIQKTTLSMIIFLSMNTKELQQRFLNDNIKSIYKQSVLSLLKREVVSKYLEENNIYINNSKLLELLLYTNIQLDRKLYETESFFNEQIYKPSIYETRELLESLSRKIDTSYFEKLFYRKKEKIIETETNTKLILDAIIDHFFQDSPHNVYLNTIEILEYSDKFNYFSREKLLFYKDLIELSKKDSQSLKNFYHKYKNWYRIDDYYDDIRLLKNDSYQKIKDECLKLEDLKKLKKRANPYNIDIYELNGEPFRMLISCRSRISKGSSPSQRNCYTLIGHENMRVFLENRIIYGYLDFDIANIMHIYEADSYSEDNGYISTNYVNRIRTSEEILKANHKSEIQIKNNEIGAGEYQRLLPSYVICFDELDDKSIEAAKELNIPIILIDRTKYKKLEGNNNLTNYETEYTLTRGRESSIERKKFHRA